MKTKTYETEWVSYTYNPIYRKWQFVVGDYKMLTDCPGGNITASKVANVINGSLKRTKKPEAPVDGLARKNIATILATARSL